MNRCPKCAAELETPLCCAVCELPLEVDDDATPFALLGVETAFTVDVKDLRRRLLRASRQIHPDFFGASSPELRALAEKNSARLNRAFEVLSDDAARADWIVKSQGGPDEVAERAMPQAFLMEVLEWNETLEEARAARSTVDPRLAGLQATLEQKRGDSMDAVRALLDPLPARGSPNLKRARQELNAVRYVDRALREIEALRLARSATR